jgi:hypothetical protein
VGDHRLFGLIWVGSFGYWQGRRAQYGPVLPGQYLRTAQIEIRLSVVCPQPQAPSLAAAAHCRSTAPARQPASSPRQLLGRSAAGRCGAAARWLLACSPGWAWRLPAGRLAACVLGCLCCRAAAPACCLLRCSQLACLCCVLFGARFLAPSQRECCRLV